MKNGLDEQYIDLLRDILKNGVEKNTRNGKVLSVFGRSIRYKFKDGKFPLLTTKKMYWKGIVTELLWFLRGETNIKYLVDNDCHIWDGDAYKKYQLETCGECDKKWLLELDEINLKTGYGSKIHRQLTKEEFINKIKTDDEFAKKWGNLGRIYGKQWRDWLNLKWEATDKVDLSNPNQPMIKWNIVSIDQIANLINDLKTNPDSRRLMVNSWNVGELDSMVLPPCHYGFQMYTRELSSTERYNLLTDTEKKSFIIAMRPMMSPDDKYDEVHYTIDNYYKHIPTRAISLSYNARSQDVPLGTPFNVASYALLLEIVARMVNMVPDELITNMGDCHIYLNQIDGVKEQIGREPYPLPSLHINTEFWLTKSGKCGVGELTDNVDSLIKGMQIDDFQIENYKSHPIIKFPLSN